MQQFSTETPKMFEGLKVIELASVLAGPAVGMFFSELGASVLKIENPETGGDVTRSWKLPSEQPDNPVSAYYCSVNWNKTTRFLNLDLEHDRTVLRQLIDEADVLISNFKPASAKKMRLDYETLRASNPRLIYAQLFAFGEQDDRIAYDIVLQAEAGYLFMTGEAGRNPVRMPVALIDIIAAHQLKEGVLLALLKRERTGMGSLVTTSLFESALASLANQAGNWLMAGHIPTRMGTRHPNIAPYGDLYETSDNKQIVLAVGTQKQFAALCHVLGREDLPGNPLFSTNKQRVQNREELNAVISEKMIRKSCDQWMDAFIRNGIPAGHVRDLSEVFAAKSAQHMILVSKNEAGETSKCVKTVAFDIK